MVETEITVGAVVSVVARVVVGGSVVVVGGGCINITTILAHEMMLRLNFELKPFSSFPHFKSKIILFVLSII